MNMIRRFFAAPLGSLWALIAGVAIGVAPHVYADFRREPKLVGRIVAAACGQMDDPRIVTQPISSVFTYVYVANQRDVPVPVVDYEMELVFKDGRVEQLETMYYTTKVLSMALPHGRTIDIPLSDSILLDHASDLVTRDEPLSGVITFYSVGLKLREQWYGVETYRLTLVDGYGTEHVVETPAAELRDVELIPHLVPGARITDVEPGTDVGATPN